MSPTVTPAKPSGRGGCLHAGAKTLQPLGRRGRVQGDTGPWWQATPAYGRLSPCVCSCIGVSVNAPGNASRHALYRPGCRQPLQGQPCCPAARLPAPPVGTARAAWLRLPCRPSRMRPPGPGSCLRPGECSPAAAARAAAESSPRLYRCPDVTFAAPGRPGRDPPGRRIDRLVEGQFPGAGETPAGAG